MTMHPDRTLADHEGDAGSPGPAVPARKQQMLVQLQGAMRRRRVRRRAARASLGAAAILLVIAIPFTLARLSPGPVSQAPEIAMTGTPESRDGSEGEGAIAVGFEVSSLAFVAATADHVAIRLVSSSEPMQLVRQSDSSASVAGIVSASATPTAPATVAVVVRETKEGERVVRSINDTELIAALARSGRDCGIIRSEDRTDIVCNSCDEPYDWLAPIGNDKEAPKESEKPGHG